MNFTKILTLAGITAFAVSPVVAQTVGIGTTKTGATSQVTAAIASITSKFAGMQMRPAPMAGTQKYIPAVNSGSLEFGAANIMQTTWAIKGEVLSKGHPNPNIKIVATLMKFRVAPLVAKPSKYMSVKDLKGARGPSGFKAAPLFNELVKAAMASSSMTPADLKGVPISALVPSWKALMAGKIDFAIGAYGSGFMKRIAQKTGGIRFLSLDNSAAAQARIAKIIPGAFIKTVKPNPKIPGVEVPTNLFHFDYILFAGKHVSNDVVYRVTKAMFENKKALVAASGMWRGFSAKGMSKDQKLAYHPGAMKLYKVKGTWNR
ncbi:MAG TPA: TAXI family TRAP transporter solute-binding subunit [Rhodospirillales bacterium]|nr:TAXI family TRAP transporter solute-binding subunit [Rhodospirillales bacterium]HIL75324.1 TAXI family TRAP transporter solute-binding subunit [Rhodospirillales bacterium]